MKDLHDGVVGADGAELFDVKRRVGAILEGKAALAGHAVAASVERGALVVLRLVPDQMLQQYTEGRVLSRIHAHNVTQETNGKEERARTAGRSSPAGRSGACT